MSPRPQQRQPPPPRSTTTLCLVWDLDETLILLDSLCLQAQGADSGARREAGCELRRCVLDLAARRFHLDKLGGGTEGEEEEDEAEEESEEEGEGGAEIGGGGGKKNAGVKLLAAEAVSAYDSGPRFCLSAEASLEAARARSAVDAVSGGWLRAASRLLAEAPSRSCSSSSPPPCPSSFAFRHFLVTAAPLAPTLAKLMVCGLSEFFPSAAVRCCRRRRKKKRSENGGGGCCRKAAEFGALQREVEREEEEENEEEEEEERKGGERRLLFLAVGKSLGDELAAEAAGWPFVRVGPRAVGKEFGGTSSSSSSSTKESRPRPDALGRFSTPITRLTLLDLMRAAGALGG